MMRDSVTLSKHVCLRYFGTLGYPKRNNFILAWRRNLEQESFFLKIFLFIIVAYSLLSTNSNETKEKRKILVLTR